MLWLLWFDFRKMPGDLCLEPLLLSISHLTRYLYEGPVKDSFNEARLQPVSDSLQQCREFRFRINPDSPVRDYPDFYSNCVHYFDVPQAHESLEVEAVSLVQTLPESRGPIPTISAEALAASPRQGAAL